MNDNGYKRRPSREGAPQPSDIIENNISDPGTGEQQPRPAANQGEPRRNPVDPAQPGEQRRIPADPAQSGEPRRNPTAPAQPGEQRRNPTAPAQSGEPRRTSAAPAQPGEPRRNPNVSAQSGEAGEPRRIPRPTAQPGEPRRTPTAAQPGETGEPRRIPRPTAQPGEQRRTPTAAQPGASNGARRGANTGAGQRPIPQTTPRPVIDDDDEDEDFDAFAARLNSRGRRRRRSSTIIGRILLVIFTVIFIVLFALVALCHTLVNGPSETVRDKLVLSAMQASATKWLPGLFLDDEVVQEICDRSKVEQPVTIPMGTLNNGSTETGDPNPGDSPNTDKPPETEPEPVDEWADAVDGMIYKTYTGASYKAYILIVRDPSRVYVGTSSDYKSGKIGSRIFDIVKREGAIAGINAGEFSDTNGMGTGNTPIGLTYSKGKCVWDDGAKRTFIGFDNDGVLHAVEKMSRDEAESLGIRDAVSFQTGNVLISNDGEKVTLHYAEGNVGMAQRTAIAQRADGAVILVVTDGRSASSLGATRNDIIDLLVSEGAVVAGMLDGGSSSMMYYEDYYIKYDIDTSTLDEYQRQGLTNRYKAFTKPRHMPTFFLVSPEGG